EVVASLCESGRPTSLLVLKTLWPVPEKIIRKAAEAARRVLVVEMNLGQYVREIERIVKDKPVSFFGEMNGDLLTPKDIREAIYP
ncbi:MAG: pyruvate flavodoxin/ferredoxin oxidoreductase, partial [Deltaproteobacteria bacterium]|nr:pyruvate flavodoxin/ferredoxin oxidoreductase [Deltaproteobacteria bacterium]